MAGFIFQSWLDKVGDAFFDGRFDIYQSAVALPLEIFSDEGVKRIETADDLRAKFDAWVDLLQSQQATHMIRTASNVEWIDKATIWGDYHTDILSNGHRVMPRFSSSMVLKISGDDAQATRVITGLTREQWPHILPSS